MEKILLTRKQLYDLVWSTPMTSISKKYSISTTRLRSICKKKNIPVPENGFWQKIQYKKSVTIQGLPTDFEGDDEIILNSFESNDDDKIISLRTKRINEILTDSDLPLKVPNRLANPDKLIIAAKEDLALNKHPFAGRGDLIGTNGGIDIRVNHTNVGRALRFMDALIKLFKARDYVLSSNYQGTCVIIYGEEINFCLQEKLRTEETINQHNWRSRQYFPSGILTFRMWHDFRFSQKIWSDGKKKIEDQLAHVLAGIELLAKKEAEERIRRDEEHKIWLEKQRIEKEIQDRKEKELSEFKLLFVRASRLHQSTIIRNYIASVECRAMHNSELTNDMIKWIEWARQKVDWYDPLINKEDNSFNDYDKANIFSDFIKEWQ
jgi:hypothetical protein